MESRTGRRREEELAWPLLEPFDWVRLRACTVRILLVLGPADVAGIQRHVTAFLPVLVRRHEVTVAFLLGAGPAADQMRATGADVRVLEGRSGHDLRAGVSFLKLLRDFRPDVVHFHETHVLALLSCVLSGVRSIVATEHCSLAHSSTPLRARVLFSLLSAAGARLTAVSGSTLAAAAELGGFTGERVGVVWNCVEMNGVPKDGVSGLRAELRVPKEAELVGAVGRLSQQKDWGLFIEVSREVSRRRPAAFFVIVGGGPEAERVRAGVRASGIEERFRVLGARANGADFIAMFDAFLMTSVHEEMPTTLLEALARETPVAGTVPAGGVREVLELPGAAEACRLITSRDPRSIADHVISLLEDQSVARKCAESGRALAKRYFSAESTAAAYEAIYRNVALCEETASL